MLPFIPRSVARSAKPTPEPRVASLSASLRHPYISGNDGVQSSDQDILPAAKSKAKQSEATRAADEYAIVTSIALSDYALWSEPGLRRLVASGDEGYIPLNHILHQPPFTTAFRTVPQETAVVKAIRAHASDSFNLRMIVSASSRPTWQEPWDVENVGGYEIRRKDWKEALQRSRNYSKHEWDDRTIYMENIPLPHRSVVSICRYTLSMLRVPPTPSGSIHVQHIWLPPHHQDNPGNSPKCKGFALVTLAHSEDAGRLLSEWPWEPRHIDLRSVAEPAEAHEAARYGFRTLSKTQWNQLQEEYLAYRQKLVDEIARAEEAVEDLAGPVGRPDVQIRPSVARLTPATPNPAAEPTDKQDHSTHAAVTICAKG
ncbi:hypothetical protein IEO21_02090 [Rhodonia placenta]|uniref:Uncharacterized protein n=1 Tax=Rhodonia placenta TaxID=104341 RepID=A0A8H7U4P6_9APHY|nr:hypothetical protein IEO21_02090 [Postia placenta]